MYLAVIVAVLLPVVVIAWAVSLLYANVNPGFHTPSAWQWVLSSIFPIIMAAYGLNKKSINQSGAAAGLVVGFLLSISCTRFLACLLALFIITSKATRFKASVKKKMEADFKEGGQRNWIQIVSNVGPAALFAVFYMWEVGSADVPVNFHTVFAASWYAIAVMSALACSNGDTLASEIGSAVGTKDPFHILSWKRVPRGTNGGVSLIGLFSSAIGGLLIGLAFYLTELVILPWGLLRESPAQWPVVLYGGFAGFIGSMIDSLLGATLQYSGWHRKLKCVVECKGSDVEYISGREFLDNHSVNLLSCLITGLSVPYVAAQTWTVFI